MPKTPKTPEQQADELVLKGKFREAADMYGLALRPLRTVTDMTRVSKKQYNALQQAWKGDLK